MEHFMEWIFRQNMEIAILVCVILVLRIVLKKVLSPKAIHLLWLIVLIKSVTYLNVPYITSRQLFTNTEVNKNFNKDRFNIDKKSTNEIHSNEISKDENLIVNYNHAFEKENNKIVQNKVAPSLFVVFINYFTIDKIKTILLWFYFFISTLFLIHLIITLIKVRNLKRNGVVNDILTKTLHALKIKFKINCRIEIYESNNISSPTLIGIQSYAILIPTNIMGNINDANLEDIITHELMHIKRKDALINLLYRIVTCLYFYNPFIWLAYFAMKKDMEFACDQDVLIKSNFKNNIRYAESLLLISKLCKQSGQMNQNAMMFIHKNTFKRIDVITNLKRNGLLSKISFTISMVIALIIFVPSYHLVSQEVEAKTALDDIKISLNNKRNEEEQIFLNNQLMNVLGVKNIFIENNRSGVGFINFKFEGSFKKFQDFVAEYNGYNIIYFNENLYFTNSNKLSFEAELVAQHKLLDFDADLKKLLNVKIKNITINSNSLIDALDQISKEIGIEIDLTSKCDYATIKFFKGAKIIKNSYQDISAWSLLVGLTMPFNNNGALEIKDGKIFLTDEASWKKRYYKILEQQIDLSANEYSLREFLQTVRTNAPDLQIVLTKTDLEDLGLNDQIKIKIKNQKGMLKSILKDSLNQIKMDFELKNQALVITSMDLIESAKVYDDAKKNFYISTNNKENKTVEINQLLEQKVFFDFSNTKLKDGLKLLSNMTGVSIVFKEGVINDENNLPIQIESNGMSLKNALAWILGNVNDVDYRVYKNSIVIQKKSYIEIPATFEEISKAVPNIEKTRQNSKEKLFVIKPITDYKLENESIKEIRIENGNQKTDQAFEIISVDNNLILVKITKGNILPGTACTIYHRD